MVNITAGDYWHDRCEHGHYIHHFNTRTFDTQLEFVAPWFLVAEISACPMMLYIYMYEVRNNHDFMCMHLTVVTCAPRYKRVYRNQNLWTVIKCHMTLTIYLCLNRGHFRTLLHVLLNQFQDLLGRVNERHYAGVVRKHT